MTLTIKVDDFTDGEPKLLDPIVAFGAKNGDIFRMYLHGQPSDTYFIGTGTHDRPICVWFDDESGNYRLSSDSKKELNNFLPHVKIRRCGPLSFMKVELVIEDYDNENN